MGMVMKKTAQNDVTGDWLQSKPNNEMFEKNFDLIFRKKNFDLIFRKKKETLPEYELNKSTGEVQKKED
jgi:catabolite regulation protein CreA